MSSSYFQGLIQHVQLLLICSGTSEDRQNKKEAEGRDVFYSCDIENLKSLPFHYLACSELKLNYTLNCE